MQLYIYTMHFANRLPFRQQFQDTVSSSPSPPQISQFGGTAKKIFRPPKRCAKFPSMHNSTSISVYLTSFAFKTFSVPFNLCTRLNGQLTCQFFSANLALYRIIYHIRC